MKKRKTSEARARYRQPISFGWKSALIAAFVLIAAIMLAFSNSFHGAFVFDDQVSILENRTLAPPFSFAKALIPPNGATVEGRPLVNLSLALCNLSGKLDPFPFHLFNLAVHILAALALFGLLRRTLKLPALEISFGKASTSLALIAALLWSLHPLQTESVTYIVQRAEAMMALFYLLTLYCSLRAYSTANGSRWIFAAVAACALGMASKEVMASAPIIVALYDRIFLFSTFREAWARRRRLYMGLAFTWIVLALGLLAARDRTGTVGWNIAELTPFEYAATQCRVLMHYLKLAVWPSPLILDYGLPDSGVPIVRSFSQWLGWGALAPLLPLAALAALKRWPPAGFLGVTFFALLAPSSSFMPIVTEVIAEHRMYLPLAAIAVFAVLSGYRAGKWLQNRFMPGDSGRKIFIYAAIGISGALVLAAGGLTYQRNGDFDSRLSLWKQNVAARPTSARAQMNLAIELVSAGDLKSALPHFENAIRLRPDYPEGNMNLGLALERMSRSEEAMPFFLKSVQVWPDYLQGNIALGDFYFRNGRYEDACTYFRKAVRIDSQNDQARNYLGAALLQLGRVQEAQVQLEEALQLNPNLAEAHNNLGALLFNQKKLQEALDHMQTAVQLNPNSAQMHYAFGLALEQTGKLPEAFVQYRASAQADSQFQPAQAGLQRVGKKLSVPGAQASRPPTAP